MLFFILLADLAGVGSTLIGRLVVLGSALLLTVVVVEATFLVAVPVAAASADTATISTAFSFSNGVFSRVFPLAPAPLLFAATGAALWNRSILRRGWAVSALVIAGLFEVAGIAAIFSSIGLIFAVAMSVVQGIWILVAAITLGVEGRKTADPAPSHAG